MCKGPLIADTLLLLQAKYMEITKYILCRVSSHFDFVYMDVQLLPPQRVHAANSETFVSHNWDLLGEPRCHDTIPESQGCYSQAYEQNRSHEKTESPSSVGCCATAEKPWSYPSDTPNSLKRYLLKKIREPAL